ncbi:MAG TPA: hypothetical protein EYG67_01760 [Campylobacterales bacterium]|nr:hypothetical protein [Campylobacterales bacterium]
MKKILNILLIGLALSVDSSASNRGDVKIIEATENIRYLAQKISKSYLYLYQNPKKTALKESLYQDIRMLEISIRDIATTTKSLDSKNILDFLVYNKDEIKEILKKEVNREKSMLMLDYSESFLEGANSIEKTHSYPFSKEEEMLMSIKNIGYLLEKVAKYYIASALNLDQTNNFNHMKQAINKIEAILKKINIYEYPKELLIERKRLNSAWKTHREFLYRSEELSIPHLLQSSTTALEDRIEKIALYHKKNQ